MSILTRMGLASKADAPTDTLSQVELRKMELARAMAVRPEAADLRRGDGRAVRIPRSTRCWIS